MKFNLLETSVVDFNGHEMAEKETSVWEMQLCMFDIGGWGDIFYANHMYIFYANHMYSRFAVSHDE